jgi:hypothetical protein
MTFCTIESRNETTKNKVNEELMHASMNEEPSKQTADTEEDQVQCKHNIITRSGAPANPWLGSSRIRRCCRTGRGARRCLRGARRPGAGRPAATRAVASVGAPAAGRVEGCRPRPS